ncbi:hypothetical protein AAHC03_01654 [Spirometra sp. Aus1]
MQKPIKILFIGDSSVGKTSLMKRFAKQEFDPHISPTIGVDFMPAVIEVNGSPYSLSLWDTAGAEANGMTALAPMYYRCAEGVLLVYDITKKETFDNIKRWEDHLNYYSGTSNIVKMLVGNKIDLDDRRVSKAEGRQLARQSSMLFVETSALTSENVNACFQELVSYIVTSPAYLELRSSPDSTNTLHLGDSPSRSNAGAGVCGAC